MTMKAKTKAGRLRGRKRIDCARQLNGQPSRAVAHTPVVIAAESVEGHRARAVGRALKTEEDRRAMMDQRIGTALGILATRKGGIGEREYRAGEELARLWRRWAAAHGIPPRTPLRSDGAPGRPIDGDERLRLDRQWRSIRSAVYRLPAGVPTWRLIERIVMDDEVPAILTDAHPSLWQAIHDAFGVIADHFRIPREARRLDPTVTTHC